MTSSTRGRPVVLTDPVQQKILDLKANNPSMTYREIALRVEISEGSVKRFFSEHRKKERARRGFHVLTLEVPQAVSEEDLQNILASDARSSGGKKKGTHQVTIEIPEHITKEEALHRILADQPAMEERGTHYVKLEIPQTITKDEAIKRVIIPELKFDNRLQAIRDAQTGREPLEIQF
ncbi:MAG: helix-turn-helix domain-containing protein [Candidatus Heimdallarchaeota archaeon]